MSLTSAPRLLLKAAYGRLPAVIRDGLIDHLGPTHVARATSKLASLCKSRGRGRHATVNSAFAHSTLSWYGVSSARRGTRARPTRLQRPPVSLTPTSGAPAALRWWPRQQHRCRLWAHPRHEGFRGEASHPQVIVSPRVVVPRPPRARAYRAWNAAVSHGRTRPMQVGIPATAARKLRPPRTIAAWPHGRLARLVATLVFLQSSSFPWPPSSSSPY